MSSDATPADAKSGCDDGNDDDDKSSEVTGDGAVGDNPPEDKSPGDGAGDDAAVSRGSLLLLSTYAGARRDKASARFHAPARSRDESDANALDSQVEHVADREGAEGFAALAGRDEAVGQQEGAGRSTGMNSCRRRGRGGRRRKLCARRRDDNNDDAGGRAIDNGDSRWREVSAAGLV